MRRILVLSTLIGLLVSMVPTFSMAQSATPIAEEPTLTETAVVEEAPTEAPATPGPNVRESQSIAPEPSALNAAPGLTVDDIAESKTVAIGDLVWVRTDNDAQLFAYTDGTCTSGERLQLWTEGSYVANHELTISFQAVRIDAPDDPKSPCLSLTWEGEDPIVAPILTIDGVAENKIVELEDTVTIGTESDARIVSYIDANCSVPAVDDGIPTTSIDFTSNFETVRSFQSEWVAFPNAPISDCLSVTWEAPAPTSAPLLTIDGVAENKIVELEDTVTIETESDANIITYIDANCSVPANEGGPPITSLEFTANFENVRSFKSEWVSFPDAPMSECLSVTWEAAPTDAPNLTVNGKQEELMLAFGNELVAETDDDATILQYMTADCQLDPVDTGESSYTHTSEFPLTNSYRAHWPNHPGAPTSDCYTVNWTYSPTLTLNEVEGDVEVALGEDVEFISDADVVIYSTLDCTGPEFTRAVNTYVANFDEANGLSARAVRPQNESMMSDCFTAQWVAQSATETPTPTATPTETATVTPTETVAPTQPPMTPTETAVPTKTETPSPQPKQTSIRIEMWDGSSIEGANWSLFAPIASQAAASPYLTGVLSPNNTAVLADIPAGNYRFVVTPEGFDSQEFAIVISEDSEEIVLQFAQPSTPAPVETAPVAPTAVPVDPKSTGASVTGLPSTGSGSATTPAILGVAGFFAAAMIAMMIGNRRRNA